jgi:hypothetical protein
MKFALIRISTTITNKNKKTNPSIKNKTKHTQKQQNVHRQQ